MFKFVHILCINVILHYISTSKLRAGVEEETVANWSKYDFPLKPLTEIDVSRLADEPTGSLNLCNSSGSLVLLQYYGTIPHHSQ